MADKFEEMLGKAAGHTQTGVLGKVEKALDSLGLGNPLARGAVGFGLGWLGMAALRPSFAYAEGGAARPWAYLDGDSADATYFPWWSVPLASGLALGLFV